MAQQNGNDQVDTPDGAADAAHTPVERLIERFGGIRPMAEKVGVPVSTVQGWKKRAAIPGARQAELRAAAEKHGIAFADGELDGVFRMEEPAVAEAAAAATAAEPAPESAPEPAPAVEPAPAPEPVAVAPAAEPAAPSVFAGAPSPVSALAHAYVHGVGDKPAAAAPEPAAPPPADSVFVGAPSPVSALAHAYMHGVGHAPAPASSGGGAGVAVVAALLAIIGAGAAVTAPLWSPDYLERSGQVSGLETRVNDLEGRLGYALTTGTSLSDRVAALEKAAAAMDRKVAGIGALAVRDLREALAGGTPFASELAAVRASGIADDASGVALDAIAPFAAKGIPTRDQVVQRFAWQVPAVVRADMGGLDSGLGERVLGWVTGVAGVLRLPVSDSSDGQSTPALMARAAGMLERGEFAAAADLVSMLQGPSAAAVQPWLAEARARIAADNASALLTKRVATLLP
ncbi:hypothetical protein HL658_22555 [Azospirillum sp. RWY-5-1]|uniref:Uncharacterized protein n=1 Tax=Azospirillum oleiclasticum TaxID=2735135 RepID=A0ABX2TBS9_9PROT|nr:mitofilin family membrane protein [Azospirillum oleiclasticum]NYZ15329.1 hypothetical protein [Azospirillum oleiclasticum]NYZ21250.1 hypothetical protein [Azospirillum oleiclasticum]